MSREMVRAGAKGTWLKTVEEESKEGWSERDTNNQLEWR